MVVAEVLAGIVGVGVLARRWIRHRQLIAWAHTPDGLAAWYVVASRRAVR